MNNILNALEIKILEARANLSEKSREAIDSVGWRKIISEIGEKKELNVEQIDDLETETELLLCGLVNPENYPGELENRLQISKDQVDNIIKEVNKFIFSKIKDELIKTIEQKVGEPAGNKTESLSSHLKLLLENDNEEINNLNYKAKIYELGQKYKLSIDQQGELEKITSEVIAGKTLSGEYENKLKSKIILPPEKISELINELNEEVFKNIRQALKTHWEERGGNINADKEKTDEDKIPIPPYAAIPINNRPIDINNKTNSTKTEKILIVQEKPITKQEIPIVEQSIPIKMNDASEKKYGVEILNDQNESNANDPYNEVV